MKINRYQQRAV